MIEFYALFHESQVMHYFDGHTYVNTVLDMHHGPGGVGVINGSSQRMLRVSSVGHGLYECKLGRAGEAIAKRWGNAEGVLTREVGKLNVYAASGELAWSSALVYDTTHGARHRLLGLNRAIFGIGWAIVDDFGDLVGV